MIGKRFWGFFQAVILGLVMYYAGTLLITWAVRYGMPGLENIRALAPLVKAVVDAGNRCCIGNEEKIRQAEGCFGEIRNLL